MGIEQLIEELRKGAYEAQPVSGTERLERAIVEVEMALREKDRALRDLSNVIRDLAEVITRATP